MTTITGVITVAVPVTDQDRAKALFVSLGFEERSDAELQPGFRWIDLALAGGGPNLSLVPADDDVPAGIDTGIRLATADARAAHATLSAVDGVQVGDLLDWESAPLMFEFDDHDGNRFYVAEVA